MKKIFFIVVLTWFTCSIATAQTMVVKVKTSAICKMCKSKIERDLLLTKGVKDAELNLDDKVVTVTYNAAKTTPELIRVAITKSGYDADSIPADPAAYNKLSSCCKKENAPH